jgi:hypothetical protein
MDTGVLIIAWIVSGVIGLVLGAIVDKLGAGFFLGLLLGPIGWIIVFLLPRDTQTQVANAESTPTSSRPERDLDSDAYKIWLGKQYNITKNDLFDKYECDEKLFATLDEALIYADEMEIRLELDERERLAIANQQRIDAREMADQQEREASASFTFTTVDFLVIVLTVLFVGGVVAVILLNVPG